MLKPTNDPIAVAKRQEAQESRLGRAALDAGGTQSFQAVRKLQASLAELRDLVIRMPSNDGRQVDVTSWSIAPSGWTTIAAATIPRPDDKTRVVVSVSSSVTAIAAGDMLAYSARLVINGVASQPMQGLPEGSGAITRCSAFPSFVREISGLVADVDVELQLNVTASPFVNDQRASLSVSAGFSVV